MPKKRFNKKVTTLKAKKTKAGINRLYLSFWEKAKDNKMKWNKETAKKIYQQSKKEHISQKKLLDERVKKSFTQKSYYVSRKYIVDILDAREVVRDRLIKNIPYKENTIIIEEKQRLQEIGLITQSIVGKTAIMFFGDYLADENLRTIIYNGKTYTKEKFITILPEIKNQLENKFESLKINADYSRSITYFDLVEIKDGQKTVQIIINIFSDAEILKEANRVQKSDSTFEVFI